MEEVLKRYSCLQIAIFIQSINQSLVCCEELDLLQCNLLFADLKSYFTQRSSSTPSTHGSGVGLEALEREEVVLQTQVESTDAVAVPMPVEDVEGQAGGGVNSSREQTQDKDASDQGIITEFNPEHVISDPGLRIPIDQFGPNIRDEVRRAFKQKGPTQSSCHNFPKGRDKRSFQKDWFKQYNWLEYSLEKGRAYCFYCYLFRNGKDDDKFGYEAFTRIGFKQWKNSYLILRKHEGGPDSAHNRARIAYVDFDKEEANIKKKLCNMKKMRK